METDPREIAIIKIKELLRHPDDLATKIEIVRKRLQQEQAALEAQLKNSSSSQVDDIQTGIQLLDSVSAQTETLKNRLRGITQLHAPSDTMEEHYQLILEMSKLHSNVTRTKKMVKCFQEWDQHISEVDTIFEAQKQAGTISPADLLRLHYRLAQLEEFRDEVAFLADNVSPDALRTLDQYFGRLDVQVDYFSDFFWSLVRNIFDYATSDEGSLIVSIAKIVEAEERADERALHLWHNEHGNEGKADSEGPAPRAYKERLFGNISEVIDHRFQLWAQDYEDDLYECLESTGFVMDDLMVVYDYVVPRFPKKWKVFQFFCLEYHKQLHNVVSHVAAAELDAGQILKLLRWTRDYYAEMKKQLGVSEKALEPRMLHDQEPLLISDYLKLVRSKVDEWMANLTRTVVQEFMDRAKPPELDADGRYGMSVAVIVFQVVNQQVDVATEANRGQLLCDVVEQCVGALKTTQKSWKKLMRTETKHLLSGKDIPGGLVEYIIALGNEQLRCVEFCDAIVERLTGMVSNKYALSISRSMDEAMGGFLDVGGFACTQLIHIIFNDLSQIFDQLFNNSWYQDDLAVLLVDTMKDYCDDFRDTFKEYLFLRLMNELMDRTMILYARSMMKNKHAVFRLPQARARFRHDLDALMEFFMADLPEDQVREEFDPLVKLTGFIVASTDILFLEYHQLRKRFPDFDLGYAENVLLKREGMTKDTLKEIMDTIRSKLDSKQKVERPSIFTAVMKPENDDQDDDV